MILIINDNKLQDTILSQLIQPALNQQQVPINPAPASKKDDSTNVSLDQHIDIATKAETISSVQIPEKISAEKYIDGEYTYYKFDKRYVRYDLDDNAAGIKHSCYYNHRPRVDNAEK